jgi:hypothetical protein
MNAPMVLTNIQALPNVFLCSRSEDYAADIERHLEEEHTQF